MLEQEDAFKSIYYDQRGCSYFIFFFQADALLIKESTHWITYLIDVKLYLLLFLQKSLKKNPSLSALFFIDMRSCLHPSSCRERRETTLDYTMPFWTPLLKGCDKEPNYTIFSEDSLSLTACISLLKKDHTTHYWVFFYSLYDKRRKKRRYSSKTTKQALIPLRVLSLPAYKKRQRYHFHTYTLQYLLMQVPLTLEVRSSFICMVGELSLCKKQSSYLAESRPHLLSLTCEYR